MSEVSSPPRHSWKPQRNFDALRVLSLLLNETGNSGSMGLMEQDLVKRGGLDISLLRRALLTLHEEGLVTYKLLQIGTGGTTDYFYQVVLDVKVEVTRPKP